MKYFVKIVCVWLFVFLLTGVAYNDDKNNDGLVVDSFCLASFPHTYSRCGVGVFRPSSRMWFYDAYGNGTTDARSGPWGEAGDIPFSGDFNSDHADYIFDDVGRYNDSLKIWWYDYNHDGDTNERSPRRWEGRMQGNIPFGGDFDCDGHNNDVGVFRPSTRTWYYDYNHDGTTNARISPWGWRGDIPVVGDFDRDGCTDDVAVFRPSNRMWYYDYNHNGNTDKRSGPWGNRGDIPVAVMHIP